MGLDITRCRGRSPTGFDILPSDNPICAQSQDATIQPEQLDAMSTPLHLQYVSSCLPVKAQVVSKMLIEHRSKRSLCTH